MSAKAVSSSSSKVFLDTNILVYQFDRRHKDKQQAAETLIAACLKDENAVISSQVMQEFMNVALKKFGTQIPAHELKIVMQELLYPLWAHTPSPDFYERALALYQAHSLSFYDALIIQAAIDLGCDTLYSEDLQAGATYGEVKVINPFA